MEGAGPMGWASGTSRALASRIATRVCVVASAAVLAGAPTRAEDRAVVIGIDDYRSPGDERALEGAVGDARRFADLLIDAAGFRPEQVTLLLDEAATSDAILGAMTDELIGRTRPGDRAVLYFAGMGTLIPGRDGGPPVRALVAHDAGTLLGRIPEDMLADLLDLIPDQEVTVIVDAGFAAAAAEGEPGVHARGRPSSTGPALASAAASGPESGPGSEPGSGDVIFGAGAAARSLWSASGSGLVAWEAAGAGVLTEALVAGVAEARADGDGDGLVTNGELLAFMEREAAGWCGASQGCRAAGGMVPAFSGDPAALALGSGVRPSEGTAGGAPATFTQALALVRTALAPSNPAGLSLSLDDAEAVRVGQVLSLRFAAARPGTLVLFDVHARGGAAVLAESLPVGPPREGSEPLRFRAAPPVGPGFLLGLLLEEGIDGADVLPPAILGEASPAAFVEALTKALQDMPGGNGKPAWSAAVLPYRIER